VFGFDVWWDKWEMKVGDSLHHKISEGITDASYFAIAISHASVTSPWVERELNAAMVLELEKRKVVVLPLLLEDAEVPILLRDKVYADFRSDYDAGLRQVIARLRPGSDKRTIETDGFLVDYTYDWSISDVSAEMKLLLFSHGINSPYTVFTEIALLPTPFVREKARDYAQNQVGFMFPAVVIENLSQAAYERVRVPLNGFRPKDVMVVVKDTRSEGTSEFKVTSRRLGGDRDEDIVYDLGNVLRDLTLRIRTESLLSSTSEEREKVSDFLQVLVGRQRTG
jgi:hypothetical protein